MSRDGWCACDYGRGVLFGGGFGGSDFARSFIIAHGDDGGVDLGEALLRVDVPLRRPDAVDVPTQATQHGRARAVAVAGGMGGVVLRPVALDPEHVLAGLLLVADGKVDPVPRAADAFVDLVATLDELVAEGLLEACVGLGVRAGPEELSGARISKLSSAPSRVAYGISCCLSK